MRIQRIIAITILLFLSNQFILAQSKENKDTLSVENIRLNVYSFKKTRNCEIELYGKRFNSKRIHFNIILNETTENHFAKPNVQKKIKRTFDLYCFHDQNSHVRNSMINSIAKDINKSLEVGYPIDSVVPSSNIIIGENDYIVFKYNIENNNDMLDYLIWHKNIVYGFKIKRTFYSYSRTSLLVGNIQLFFQDHYLEMGGKGLFVTDFIELYKTHLSADKKQNSLNDIFNKYKYSTKNTCDYNNGNPPKKRILLQKTGNVNILKKDKQQ